MNKSVTFIVPAYNAEKTINNCINSILAQSYPVFEVIIVNDGSTDNTLKNLNEYNNNPKVKIITIKNSGVSVARNIALDNVKTHYVAFVDADDYISPDFLLNMIEPYSNSRVDLVVSQINYISNNSQRVTNYLSGLCDKDDFMMSMFKINGPKGYLWNRLWKMNIIKKYNIRFNETIAMAEDLIFNIDYCKHVREICVLKSADYFYVQNSTSLSSSIDLTSAQDNYLKIFHDFLISAISASNKIEPICKRAYYASRANITIISLAYLRNINLKENMFFKFRYRKKIKKIKRVSKAYKNYFFSSPLVSTKQKILYFLIMYLPFLLKVIDYRQKNKS